MAEVTRCQALFEGQLIIRRGIEISEPHRYPERVGHVLQSQPWDFVLGSLHWLTPWINTFEPAFFTYCGDWRQSFRAYFTELLQLARYGDYDVLAHLDYPARYGQAHFGADYDIREFEPEVRAILKVVIERGAGTEINTSMLRRGRKDPNPPQTAIDWYRQMGGTILTIGSDSHNPAHTGQYLTTALQMARAAGFTQIATFERRRPTLIDI